MISKKISINTQIADKYKNKSRNSNVFVVKLPKGNGSGNTAIPLYKISPGNGNLLNTGKTYSERPSNTYSSSESEDIILRAKELLAKARLQADSIIQSAMEEKNKYKDESKKYVRKTDSLQNLVERKVFENQLNEMEGVSKKNMRKLQDQNEKLKKLLSKEKFTQKDSLVIIENRLESTELFMEDLDEQLKQAELAGDTVLVAELSEKIKDLAPELELMRKQRDEFQKKIIQKEKELKMQAQRLYLSVGLALLLLVVAFILLIFYKNKKKSNKVLGEKNTTLNKQKEEIRLQAENLSLANKEITRKNTVLTEQKEQIEEQHEHIRASVKYASSIQSAILPVETDMQKVLDYFIIFSPKDVVSGDFYWYSEIPKESLSSDTKEAVITAAIDCTGHGVPGAFMSMIGSRILNEVIYEQKIHDTAQIMTMLDAGVKKSLKQDQGKNNDGMDISMCRIEKLTNGEMRVIFTGAKRPLFIYDSEKQKLETVKGDRRSVGGKPKKRTVPFTNKEFTLKKDSIIYMTTDGFIDQNNPKRTRFGTPRFEKFLSAMHAMPLEKQKIILQAEMKDYMQDEEQRDDMTVIGVKNS